MARSMTHERQVSEVEILGRLLGGTRPMSASLARHFLRLGFDERDRARMHQLALKNQKGAISADERHELLAYTKAGCLLGILQSRARRFLKNPKSKAS